LGRAHHAEIGILDLAALCCIITLSGRYVGRVDCSNLGVRKANSDETEHLEVSPTQNTPTTIDSTCSLITA
jgi:hypothetical protein